MSIDALKTSLSDRYRIERELGAGGMATVYLAEDLKHKRHVALKVLKPELAAVLGAERFVQEITTTAALQHPHILPLFDSGSADGFLFYVMPYIEGETLRSKLDRETQLGIDEAVRITREVADALDYAHRHGVIHRDIKPENILLHDGRPMVADFGIALALSAAAGGRMTETGLSLGTPHYMSPEQATAEKEITARSDVYSLGSVLYEMLTGSPPHVGASAQQIIMKIVTEQAAPVTAMRKSVPPNVAAAVAQSIEKLPADRFESAKAFADALGNHGFRRGGAAAETASGVSGRQRLTTRLLAGVTFAAIALAAWGWLRPVPPGPVTRSQIILEGMAPYQPTGYLPLAISPSGSRIAYTDYPGNSLLLEQDQLHPRIIHGTENFYSPYFSPDGNSMVFTTGFPGSLKIAPLGGGLAVTLVADSTSGWGAAWSEDDWIYYITGNGGSLRRIRPAGGASEAVAQVDSSKDELLLSFPSILPGGKAAVATVWRRKAPPDIVAIDFQRHEIRPIIRGVRAFYAASGHLVYVQSDGALMASAFDARSFRLSGRPVRVGDDVLMEWGTARIALSAGGTLLYQPARHGDQLVRVTRDGHAQVVDTALTGQALVDPVSSPDGSRLAIAVLDGGSVELWVKQLDHGPFTRLANGGTLNYRPFWSTDGRSILFPSDRTGLREQLFTVPADGSESPRRAFASDRSIDEGAWSADGRWLVYRAGSGGSRDVYALRPATDSAPGTPVAVTGAEEFSPTLSPDGHWLVYATDESGKYEVYVRPFPRVGASRQQVSDGGGSEPVWAHSGRELFYRDAAGRLVAVRVAAGTTFAIESRQVLFDASAYGVDANHADYSVTPDDRAFYFIRPRASTEAPMVLVRNWFQELSAQMKAAH